MLSLEFQTLTWKTRSRSQWENSLDRDKRVLSSSYLVTAYGRTMNGESVRLTILDHRPSFYVMTTDTQHLDNALKKGHYTFFNEVVQYTSDWLVRVEPVERFLLYGFRNGQKDRMLKVTCANPDVMKQMVTAVKYGGLKTCNGDLRKFNPLHAFFHQHGIQPCSWLRVKCDHDDIVSWKDMEGCFMPQIGHLRGNCDIDLVVCKDAIETLDRMDIAPIKIMSFDIEQNGIPQEKNEELTPVVQETDEDEKESEQEEEKFRFPDSTLPECEISTICLRSFVHGKKGMAVHAFTYKPVCVEQLKMDVRVTTKEAEDGFIDVELHDKDTEIHVHQGKDEKTMLELFVEHMERERYDVDQGWNQLGFDWQAIHIRCNRHEISLRSLGKEVLRNEPKLHVTNCNTQSRGNSQIAIFETPGLIHHDLLRVWKEDHKEDSYTLEAVSSSHMGEHKIPIDPNHITSWAKEQDPAGLTRVVVYCIQDTALPERLAKKYRKLLNLIMFCNLGQILPDEYLQRGSNVRSMSLGGSRMHRMNIVSLDIEHAINKDWHKYQGATVLEPITGLYKTPIATLDFAGLYPANINSNWVDYMRFVEDPQFDNLPGVQYRTVEWTDVTYVKKSDKKITGSNIKYEPVTQGPRKGELKRSETVRQRYVIGEDFPSLMPTLMTELRQKRKDAKKQVKKYNQLAEQHKGTPEAEENVLMAEIWDANQLGIKLLMNAGYGFLGAEVSPLPHRGLAMAVTYFGRQMIGQAQRFTFAAHGIFKNVETPPSERTDDQIHAIAQGRSLEDFYRDCIGGVKIVYGDTDSIMVEYDLPPELQEKLELVDDEDAQNEILRWVFDKAEDTGKRASAYLNLHFCYDTKWEDGKLVHGAQDLEFEKVFYPGAFYSKKRYLYRKFVKPSLATGKIGAQGMAMVRRDFSKMLRKLLWDVAHDYMSFKYTALIDKVRCAFEKLAEMAAKIDSPQDIDLELIEITKQLASHYDESRKLPSHAVVAQKMRLPTRGENPMPGDRIGYVQIIDKTVANKTQAVDSVKWIRKEKLPIDILQIASDFLNVLVQVITLDSSINLEHHVGEVLQQIQRYQQTYDARQNQLATKNRGLGEWFKIDPNKKRQSSEQCTNGIEHVKKQKKQMKTNKSGTNSSIDSFLKK
jgi:DNA polymerase elongation subunit (family B)